MLAALGVSSPVPVSQADSWSELEAQNSDSDGREQLSHLIQQFLLLAELEVSGLFVVCNVFRSGRRYHPSQFRFTVDSAKLLNDFSHLKGKSMPSSSVEHLTHIVFGRQFRIGNISIDARDCLADHCTATAFDDQQWVPIFSANLSPLSALGSCADPFCKLQFQLKGFDSDLDISVLKVEVSIDDAKVMLDFVHLQLLLSCAKTFLNESSSKDVVACSESTDSGLSERAKRACSSSELAGSVEEKLTICIKSVSFLVACIDQPLRNKKRRSSDSDWLCTLQGLRFIADPVAIHATSDVVLVQELFSDGRRHEIVRVQSITNALQKQCGVSVKAACDGSSTQVHSNTLFFMLSQVPVCFKFQLWSVNNSFFLCRFFAPVFELIQTWIFCTV